MLASARVAWLARRAAEYGVHTGPVRVDLHAVRERKRSLVESFRQSGERKYETTERLELIRGEASFADSRTVRVQTADGAARQLTAELIFINTGLRSARPPIEGIDRVPALDNVSIMELDELPEHLIVLGGGYVGVEFAQMFRRFGSEVTLLQRGRQLLSPEDPDVADEFAKILREDGIDVRLETSGVRVEREASGRIRLTVHGPEGAGTLTGSHLLNAAGRVPNTDALNLPAAGVETDERGFIPVSDRLETNVAGVYALGDVKGGPAFTHVSYDDYRVVKTNLLEGGNAGIGGRPACYTVFSDPQLGRVGVTEREAREQGRRVRVAKMPMSHVARALEFSETRGFMKAIVDGETDEILGAAVLGMEGGELMSMIQIAMLGGLPYTALRDAMFAHPTLAESLNNLFANLA